MQTENERLRGRLREVESEQEVGVALIDALEAVGHSEHQAGNALRALRRHHEACLGPLTGVGAADSTGRGGAAGSARQPRSSTAVK
jgi:hypothetical protein